MEALVYLNALALDVGEYPRHHPALPRSRAPFLPRPFPQPDGTQGTDLYIDPASFRSVLAADVPARIQLILQAARKAR